MRSTSGLWAPPTESFTPSMMGWLMPTSKPGILAKRSVSVRTKAALFTPAGHSAYGFRPTGTSMCEGVQGSVPSSLRPSWVTT